jgi:competence protein ComEC
MSKTFFVSLGLIVISLLLIREIALLPDGRLHLYILDVGQGDATLLVTPSGKQILIDGGPDLSALTQLDGLFPFFDRTIELLVITHPDADHITALPEVLSRYTVEKILMTGASHSSGAYDALRSIIQQQSIPVMFPHPSADIVMGDGVVLDVIWPHIAETSRRDVSSLSSNNQSIVLRALYNDHSMLLTGDIERKAEKLILASGADIRSDVLRVPHHGSRTSSSTGFLLAVNPEIGLISAGRDNRFGHPHKEVTDRYKRLAIDIIATSKQGTVSLVFD